MCIRCGEHETPPDRPYCVHCTFAVRAEVEDGLRKLADYLSAWAAFDEWCSARDRRPRSSASGRRDDATAEDAGRRPRIVEPGDPGQRESDEERPPSDAVSP